MSPVAEVEEEAAMASVRRNNCVTTEANNDRTIMILIRYIDIKAIEREVLMVNAIPLVAATEYARAVKQVLDRNKDSNGTHGKEENRPSLCAFIPKSVDMWANVIVTCEKRQFTTMEVVSSTIWATTVLIFQRAMERRIDSTFVVPYHVANVDIFGVKESGVETTHGSKRGRIFNHLQH